MSRRWSTLGGAWIAAALSSGCNEPNQTGRDLSHDRHDPVRMEASFNWIQLKRSQFIDAVLEQGGRRLTPVGPEFSPLANRAGFWIDVIDSTLRELYPTELAEVPVPKPIVISEQSANAFIAAAFTCFDVPANLSRPGRKADKVYLSLNDGGSISAWPPSFKCVHGSTRELKSAVRAFNSRHEGCQLHLDEDGLKPSGKCGLEKDIEGIGSARQVVLAQTANWVTIHAGLFPAMPSERAFVGVIAHELAHYYRSHITSYSDEYGFFYKMKARNPDHKPHADPSLEKTGKLTINASKILVGALPTVSGQHLAPEVYLLAGSIAEYSCYDGSCPATCQQIADWENQDNYVDEMGLYPFTEPKDTEFYREFEANALQCLTETEASPDAEITQQVMHSLMLNPVWIPFEHFLSANGKMYVRRFLAGLAMRAPDGELTAGEAIDWVDVYSNHFVKEKVDADKTLDKARKMKLGYYTTEQEADEQSIEWLESIGFDPKAGIDTYLALAGNGADQLGGHVFGGKTCRQLYASNWLDEHGQEVFVPIGNYDAIHHSSCFRAYNVHREIIAHEYVDSGSEPQAPGSSWQELQRLASKVSIASAVTPQPHSLTLRANRHWKDCPLAHQH